MPKYSFETLETEVVTQSVENNIDALIIGYAAMARAIDKMNPEFSTKLMETLDNAYKMQEGATSQEALRQLAIMTKVAVTKPE